MSSRIHLRFSIIPFTFLFSTLSLSGMGQSIEWEENYGGDGSEAAKHIEKTKDGNFIVVGYSSSNSYDLSGNHGSSDVWLFKLNGSGNLEWSKNYGGSNVDVGESVHQADDGGYFIAAISLSDSIDVSGNYGDYDYWILKVDSLGNLEWENNFGGSDEDLAKSIRATDDGGCIVVGTTSSNDGDVTGHKGAEDIWVLKLDSSGVLEWESCYGNQTNDRGNSIRQTDDGGYAVAGSNTTSGGDVSSHNGGWDYWLIKLDSTGSIEWEKGYGGSLTDRSPHLEITENGFILSGESQSNDIDVSGNHGWFDIWTVKVDSTGSIEWEDHFGGSSSENTKSIRKTHDNGYIIGGITSSDDHDVSGFHGYKDYWALKLDSTGTLEWENCYGNDDQNHAYSVCESSPGKYILAGRAEYDGGDVSNVYWKWDAWILNICGPTSSSMIIDTCTPYTVPSGDTSYASSGHYVDTLYNANSVGCDSLIHIDLSIDTSSSFIAANTCSAYTVPSGDTTYTRSGTFLDTLSNSKGCDSIITIDLSVDTTNTFISPSTCYQYTTPSGDSTYFNSGTYTDTLVNSMGCDSIITIDLSILDSSTASIAPTVCDEYTVPSGDTAYTLSGTYLDTIQNSVGCDSIITINLTVFQSSSNTISDTACYAYTIPSGTKTYSSSGIYNDTLTNQMGCDSLLSIDLTIGDPDTTISVTNDSILSSQGMNLQWLDCNGGHSAISGDTSAAFYPSMNGTYALEARNDGCMDTSLCLTSLPTSDWNAFSQGTPYEWTDVHFVDSLTGWSVVLNGKVHGTDDGGRTWSTLLNSSDSLHASFFLAPNTGWVVGNNGVIYNTSNGGNSWSSQTLGTGEKLLDVHFIDTSNGWVCGNNGDIFHTDDGGGTWSAQSSPSNGPLHSIHFTGPNKGICVGENGTILISSDGGNNWSSAPSPSPDDLNGVQLMNDSNAIAVGESGTILRTKDGGSSWTGEFSGTTEALHGVHFTDSSGGWAIGENGTLLHSSADGNVWTSQAEAVFHDLKGIHFLNDRYGWTVGENSTLLFLELQNADSNSTGNSSILERDKEAGSMLSVHPNPAKDHLTIEHSAFEGEELRATLYNGIGQTEKSLYLDAFGKERTILDLSDVERGVHFLKLEWIHDGERAFLLRKIIVK